MAAVVRAEKSLGPDKEAGVVFVPANSLAGLERGRDFRNALDRGFHRLEKAGQENRAAFIGQCQRLLGRQSKPAGGGVVGDEFAGGLRRKPFRPPSVPCYWFCRGVQRAC